jgi:hypothetical protein
MIRPLVAFLALGLSGCIAVPFPCKKAERTRIPLEQPQLLPGSEEKLREGDNVVVYTKKGQTDEYEVVRLEDAGFIGTSWDGKRYRVLYKNVDRAWVIRKKWSVCTITLHG